MAKEKSGVGSWQEHQLLVMSRLDDLKDSVKELTNSFDTFKTETHDQLSKIKQSAAIRRVKSGLYGTMGGSIVILLNTIIKWAIENHK